MSLGAAFAGFAQGAAQGLGLRRQMDRDAEERKDREEARKQMAEDRARLKLERERQDADLAQQKTLLQGLAGVRRTEDNWGAGYQYARDNNAPLRDDEGNVMPGVQSTARRAADVYRDQAHVARGIPTLQAMQLAQQFDSAANAEADRERGITRQTKLDAQGDEDRRRANELRDMQLRQARAAEALRQATFLYEDGNLQGALAAVGKAYSFYPDGRELVMGANGTFGLGAGGKDGKPVTPGAMYSINSNNVGRLLDRALRANSPEVWAKVSSADREAGDSQARRGLMAAQTSQAAAEADWIRSGGKDKRKLTAGRPSEDGTVVVVDEQARPVHVMLAGGLTAPVGWTQTRFDAAQDEAQKVGVRVTLGTLDGAPRVGFVGRDGKVYESLDEAAKARPVK